MPISSSSAKYLRLLPLAGALSVIILGGCATPAAKGSVTRPLPNSHVPTATRSPAAAISTSARVERVVRYGRYTLVELSPLSGQEDLMQQIVDVTIPPTLAATLGDALRYVLLRSGFTLCDSQQIRILNTLPLPAADEHLGPLTLETALRILVGPAWKLKVNEMTRRVCFLPVSPLPAAGNPAGFGPSAHSPAQDATRMTSKLVEHRP